MGWRGGVGPQVWCPGVPLPRYLSHDAFDVTHPPTWTQTSLKTLPLLATSFAGGNKLLRSWSGATKKKKTEMCNVILSNFDFFYPPHPFPLTSALHEASLFLYCRLNCDSGIVVSAWKYCFFGFSKTHSKQSHCRHIRQKRPFFISYRIIEN